MMPKLFKAGWAFCFYSSEVFILQSEESFYPNQGSKDGAGPVAKQLTDKRN
ncbi:hypothetical protein MTO98_22420 [Mucilaginibacter sp. SMC90]|uniref:hypothetical protein n=1 Tax=Mucilaginibacter sp. SMC90 TaxID=2929803 RepID=UPI001FB20DF4|nr:hypothetical protein [Mucilaginibacter sp. SMC90]UOE47162.1 hypothetical protein MTO98_22420 [Mucilaginibacter sp. SMC90]